MASQPDRFSTSTGSTGPSATRPGQVVRSGAVPHFANCADNGRMPDSDVILDALRLLRATKMAAPGGEWSNLREVTVWTADGSARMRRVAAALGRLESAPLRTDHRGAANPLSRANEADQSFRVLVARCLLGAARCEWAGAD